MTKHTALGSTKRYRVDIYQRYNIRRKPINSLQKAYDPKLFALYSSHSQAQEGAAAPKEQRSDTRGNLLSGKRFILVIPLFLIGMIFAIYKLYQFSHPEPKHAEDKPLEVSATGTPGAVPPLVPEKVVPKPMDEWRIIGYYQLGNDLTLVMRDQKGTTRYVVAPPNIRFAGLDVGAVLGDEVVSNWSGPPLTNNQARP